MARSQRDNTLRLESVSTVEREFLDVAWLVVALVLGLAVGPLLLLLPSKRDKLVGECRQAARRAGLIVEMTRIPKLDATANERVSAGGVARDASIECAAYRLPLAPTAGEPPTWRLLRSPRENRYLAGWTTLDPPRNAPPAGHDYWRLLAAIVDALPGGCIAVEATPRSIGWLGLERLGDRSAETVVSEIGAGLTAIAKLHEDFTA